MRVGKWIEDIARLGEASGTYLSWYPLKSSGKLRRLASSDLRIVSNCVSASVAVGRARGSCFVIKRANEMNGASTRCRYHRIIFRTTWLNREYENSP